jgi:flagellar biosynthesis/type III secretory pathway protein FliH
MDFELWNYPHVDTLITIDNPEAISEPIEQRQPEPEPEPEPSPEIIAEEQARLAHVQRLEEHLDVLRKISETISTQINHVNETLITNITNLVKKITESVILKEISLDRERLKYMIEHAFSQIQRDGEPCTIQIAPEHHDYFSTHAAMPPDIIIKSDDTLKLGDFRIKTTYSELESILEHRLNEIFEL